MSEITIGYEQKQSKTTARGHPFCSVLFVYWAKIGGSYFAGNWDTSATRAS